MSSQNTMIYVEVLLKEELAKWQNGENQWTVSNQHDQFVIESALEKLSIDSIEKAIKQYEGVDLSILSSIEWAYAISVYKPEAIASAWID